MCVCVRDEGDSDIKLSLRKRISDHHAESRSEGRELRATAEVRYIVDMMIQYLCNIAC